MRVASDIGGTFTDLAYLDEKSGEVGMAKVSTTPADFAEGVVETLKKAQLSVSDTGYFVHGSTVIINALTERKGAKTGLITTKGFRDVLEIGRANRPDIYNMYYTKPPPFVPRYLRLEVGERMNYKGEVLTPLDEADVRSAVDKLRAEGVQALAVCLLHSYANPSHELECGEIIKEMAPDLPITLSHQITQEWREYERTSTAVLNSYVHPLAQVYLDNLEGDLTEMGMKGHVLHVMQSNGGSATFAAGKASPINLVESGPVAGVIGAANIGEIIGEPNVISLDIGGTTAKTSLIEKGTPRITTEYKFEQRRDFAGYPILAPSVDIVEIGAGGGSIAWVDKAGALQVGPVSAGADPGPACYGWGGDQPTVTDANLVAGRINPDYFLGGEISLDTKKAEAALKPIADAFSMNLEQAAMGVIRIADSNMINALKLVSVRRGYDPRDFVLIAFGGAGAMHAGALMRELRCKKVIIPTEPAVFSAWGMLMTDLRRDYIRTLITRTDKVDPQDLDGIYAEMERQATRDLTDEGIKKENLAIQRFADMRYAGQEHTVKVSLPSEKITEKAIQNINDRFHTLHEQTYTFRLDTPVELVNYHVTALGRVKKPEIKKLDGRGGKLDEAHKATRRVNFDELGFHEADIYERDLFPIGETVKGPAVIEEPASTTVVFPDQQLTRDQYGFLHIEPADKPTSR
ncbi:MAG: hydantoinase/oxoprolinase family protein [Chloroflexi bacterium]|nr:hydantoinase/oxoprolinase family protein [Chloroflexota bacterium]